MFWGEICPFSAHLRSWGLWMAGDYRSAQVGLTPVEGAEVSRKYENFE